MTLVGDPEVMEITSLYLLLGHKVQEHVSENKNDVYKNKYKRGYHFFTIVFQAK